MTKSLDFFFGLQIELMMFYAFISSSLQQNKSRQYIKYLNQIKIISILITLNLQQLSMKSVITYIDRNKIHIDQIYSHLAKDHQIPASNLYNFLKEIFNIQQIRFLRKGKDYFKDQDNEGHVQKIIQQYYKTTADGRMAKFYLYKINFDFQGIQDYLEYWLNTDKSITVQYPYEKKQQTQPKQSYPTLQNKSLASSGLLRESMILQNQFLHDQQRIPLIRQAYLKQISALESMLIKIASNTQQSLKIQHKIELYKKKIEQLQPKKPQVQIQNQKNQKQVVNIPKSKTQTSRTRKQVNFKLLFQFYAKQNYLTGIKASFERIQHESQTINYQKLVHFLKQYDIFPQKPKNQKKLHNLYVRICSSTRDLHYPEFMQLLQKLPQILFDGPQSLQIKKESLMAKIQTKEDKNKLLHNPFHSLEKNDFRIDSHNLKYSFKLKPLQGKLEQEVNHELQSRRKQKSLAKEQSAKTKEQQFLTKLKKLMSIDPYHPLVVKNAELLQKRSPSATIQPVANLENMQKFRDINFNMKAQFGISDFEEDPLKQISRRYDTNKRAQLMQRQQSQRMSIMMNGIIERSDAKIQKFTSSPTKKRQISSKMA